MSLISEQVDRLRTIFERYGLALDLAPGATPAQIEEVERECGFQLDADTREFYAIANGGSGWAPCLAAMTDEMTPFNILPLEMSAKWWREWLPYDPAALLAAYGPPEEGRDPRIQPKDFRRRGWLPLAEYGGGNSVLFFDTEPTEAGVLGQIIAYQHDPEGMYWCAASWLEMLHKSNDTLEEHGHDLLFLDGLPLDGIRRLEE